MNYPTDYQEVLDYLNERDERLSPRKKHRLPLEQYALSDREFLFTINARQHQQPFTDPELAKKIIAALLWRKHYHNWRMFCYCLMPDHLHFIMHLLDEEIRYIDAGARGLVPYGVLEHIGAFKRYTTTQIWWKCGGANELWHKSSYDRIIRYNDSVESAVAYVLNNPVRKRIVETWSDYPFSGVVDEC